MINSFEVDTEKLEAFVAGWRERAELMSKRPGFRSPRLHRALRPDARFQVVDVAQWDSTDALNAVTAQEDWRGKVVQAVDELGFTATADIYRVAFQITAP